MKPVSNNIKTSIALLRVDLINGFDLSQTDTSHISLEDVKRYSLTDHSFLNQFFNTDTKSIVPTGQKKLKELGFEMKWIGTTLWLVLGDISIYCLSKGDSNEIPPIKFIKPTFKRRFISCFKN